tara:strand:- start:205 stop:672 length:468 start_codon:yes stop_codon:yes gene_type:complete
MNAKQLLNNILSTLGYSSVKQALLVDNGYCLNLDGVYSSDVQSVINKYDNNEINLNGVIIALSKLATKKRTKVQGLAASFQSDKECAYIGIKVTKQTEQTKQVLDQLFNVLTGNDWGYSCGELIDGEGGSFFGSSEKTIKEMQDDYKAALIEVLN